MEVLWKNFPGDRQGYCCDNGGGLSMDLHGDGAFSSLHPTPLPPAGLLVGSDLCCQGGPCGGGAGVVGQQCLHRAQGHGETEHCSSLYNHDENVD